MGRRPFAERLRLNLEIGAEAVQRPPLTAELLRVLPELGAARVERLLLVLQVASQVVELSFPLVFRRRTLARGRAQVAHDAVLQLTHLSTRIRPRRRVTSPVGGTRTTRDVADIAVR